MTTLKLYIADELRKANKLDLMRACPECGMGYVRPWLRSYDAIKVDYPIGAYQAAIALFSKGALLAVIEVGDCEPQKAAWLAKHHVRWVALDPVPFLSESVWNSGLPLPEWFISKSELLTTMIGHCDTRNKIAYKRDMYVNAKPYLLTLSTWRPFPYKEIGGYMLKNDKLDWHNLRWQGEVTRVKGELSRLLFIEINERLQTWIHKVQKAEGVTITLAPNWVEVYEDDELNRRWSRGMVES